MNAQPMKLQRKCGCGGSCGSCAEKERKVQRSANSHAAGAMAVPSIAHALDSHARNQFEERFGHDFSGVRVHAISPQRTFAGNCAWGGCGKKGRGE